MTTVIVCWLAFNALFALALTLRGHLRKRAGAKLLPVQSPTAETAP
jgi:hypothetical protein